MLLRHFASIWLVCLLDLAAADTQTADEIQQVIRQLGNDSMALGTTKAASWVDSPTVRGSMDILQTCIVTLIACVYTVLHLNIPAKDGPYAGILDKIKWVFLAIVLPETVLMVALSQLFEARSLKLELGKLSAKDSALPQFDLQFCFFVVMGGFQVPLDDIQPGPQLSWIDRQYDRLPLSPQGFLKLIEHGGFDEETMLKAPRLGDRSKANVFQKALVLTQVLWMAIQCAVRKAQGLPVTLLEIHTLVHVVCTVVLYAVWFYKPLDMGHPEVLTLEAEAARNLVALAVQSQLCNSFTDKMLVLYPSRRQDPNRPGLQDNPSPAYSNELQQYQPTVQESPRRWVEVDHRADVVLWSGVALPCGAGLRFFEGGKTLRLTPSDVNRIERATTLRRTILNGEDGPDLATLFCPGYDVCLSNTGNMKSEFYDNQKGRFWNHFEKVLSVGANFETISNLSSPRNSVVRFYSMSFLGMCLSCVYSGIHLAAWGFQFPTHAESILWRVSGIASCVVLPLYSVLLFFTFWLDSLFDDLPFSNYKIFAVFSIPVFLANISARVFLTVESFASLRSLPVGAYSMPAWLQMLPHL
ncbi:hypothetical protein CCHL11_08676 [Colletotrichum chlorophyti]|uniref:Uncharacterized protein n=1 Tax=Colletotrichum chlorophyti TaxID=708187 RepID=A0A1Q8RD43_9PEZI|nr:hypothetical protein CCHL11_08676 [Colletotrichum chlorophyti]